jgi:hypothetical protein
MFEYKWSSLLWFFGALVIIGVAALVVAQVVKSCL